MKIAFVDSNTKVFSEYSRILSQLLPEGTELVQFRGWAEATEILFEGAQWKDYVCVLLSEESGRLERELAQFCQGWNVAIAEAKTTPSLCFLFASSIRSYKTHQLPWLAGTSIAPNLRKNEILETATYIRRRLELATRRNRASEDSNLTPLGQLL